MKRLSSVVLIAAVVLELAACSSATTSPSASKSEVPVAQQLRDMDVADKLPAGSQADYDAAFKALSTRCKEEGAGLGNEVQEVLHPLQNGGVRDETRLTVMQHVAASIPGGSSAMSCADVGGAYVTLRGGHT